MSSMPLSLTIPKAEQRCHKGNWDSLFKKEQTCLKRENTQCLFWAHRKSNTSWRELSWGSQEQGLAWEEEAECSLLGNRTRWFSEICRRGLCSLHWTKSTLVSIYRLTVQGNNSSEIQAVHERGKDIWGYLSWNCAQWRPYLLDGANASKVPLSVEGKSGPFKPRLQIVSYFSCFP